VVIEFTNAMATLLAAGLTLRDALDVAQTIYLRGDLNAIVVSLLSEIETGCSVYEALQRQRSRFPPIYAGFVRVGEKIGSLEGIFARLAGFLAEDARIRDKLVTALIYPSMVLAAAVLGSAGVGLFVVPRAVAMFAELGSAIPASLKQMATNMRLVAAAVGVLAAAAVVGGIAVLIARRLSAGFRERTDHWILGMPVIGRPMSLRENLNLVYAMEALTEGGLAVEDALQEATLVLSNTALVAATRRARAGRSYEESTGAGPAWWRTVSGPAGAACLPGAAGALGCRR
jgi:type II secretory pathway component PulF